MKYFVAGPMACFQNLTGWEIERIVSFLEVSVTLASEAYLKRIGKTRTYQIQRRSRMMLPRLICLAIHAIAGAGLQSSMIFYVCEGFTRQVDCPMVCAIKAS
jgi:hypothetical protein